MVKTLYLRLAMVAAVVALAALASTASTGTAVRAAAPAQLSVCIGHRPQPFITYYGTCTGHDEPEIDPLSNSVGSARDLKWTLVLPRNGSAPVDSVGPTFWTGGTVTDPRSLLEQAFLEVQFYPNSRVTQCTSDGGYVYNFAPNVYTVCSPVWKINSRNNEVAAFNGMLTDARDGGPLIMHAGDTITDHQYVTSAADGMHITVVDVTTGHSGTIVLHSATDGPLMPAFSVQALGNSLGWGLVHDAPNSLVWEIGHTGNFTSPPGQYCVPGSTSNPPCFSYNIPTWLSFSPLQIKEIQFGNGEHADSWAVVSDFGGKAEVQQYCGKGNYGTPFCWYPWYAYNDTLHAFTYGGDYPGTSDNFGRADQFQKDLNCRGPYGPNSTYCATVIHRPSA